MSVKVFSLKHVDEDEANAVRQLLQQHAISFYETSENIWRTSSPAIWLHHPQDYASARELIDVYQAQRTALFQQQRSQLKTSLAASLIADFKRKPGRFILLFMGALIVVLVSVRPFFVM